MKDKATTENISHGDFRQLKYSTLSRRSLLALGGVVMLDISGCGGGGSKKLPLWLPHSPVQARKIR
jgi:hypothetical protein